MFLRAVDCYVSCVVSAAVWMLDTSRVFSVARGSLLRATVIALSPSRHFLALERRQVAELARYAKEMKKYLMKAAEKVLRRTAQDALPPSFNGKKCFPCPWYTDDMRTFTFSLSCHVLCLHLCELQKVSNCFHSHGYPALIFVLRVIC